MEVVNFHFKRTDPFKFSPLFEPTRKEYIPENFTRLTLMQLLVIPKNVSGGHRDLKALREAKSAELAESNLQFKLEAPHSGWPEDTFRVSISTPYQLFQLYTQDERNFYIATTGLNPEDPVLTSASERLVNGIERHVYPVIGKRVEENILFENSGNVLRPGLMMCALGFFLWLLPARGNTFSRLNFVGKATIGYAAAWHLVAFPILFVSWRYKFGALVNDATIILCAGLIMPWVNCAVSRRMEDRNPWRAFKWSAFANILPVALGCLFLVDYIVGRDRLTGARSFAWLSLLISATALLNAAALGLTHQQQGPQGKDS